MDRTLCRPRNFREIKVPLALWWHHPSTPLVIFCFANTEMLSNTKIYTTARSNKYITHVNKTMSKGMTCKLSRLTILFPCRILHFAGPQSSEGNIDLWFCSCAQALEGFQCELENKKNNTKAALRSLRIEVIKKPPLHRLMAMFQ